MHYKTIRALSIAATITVILSLLSCNKAPHVPTSYTAMTTAAIAGLSQAAIASKTIEYVGVVYSLGGMYYYTIPQSSGSNVGFHNVEIKIPKGARFVALYHTHPAGEFSNYFSKTDVDEANALNITSYVAILADDRVIVYIPNKTPITSTDGLRAVHGVSLGETVGTL